MEAYIAIDLDLGILYGLGSSEDDPILLAEYNHVTGDMKQPQPINILPVLLIRGISDLHRDDVIVWVRSNNDYFKTPWRVAVARRTEISKEPAAQRTGEIA